MTVPTTLDAAGWLRNYLEATPHLDRGFLNQTHDLYDGLIYLNNRHHDPGIGAFISVDPLVAKTGEPYIYGGGNPATYSDPSGLEVCYDSGPKKGQCYEAADGEEWAQTPLEEVLIVQNPTVDPETVVGTWRTINAAQWDPEDEVQQEQRWTLFFSSLYGGEFDPLVLLIDTVGDASTATGYVATGCGLFAWTVVGAECAAIAGGASLGLGATEAALLAATRDPDAKCSAAGVALDVIVPDVPVPTSGDFAGEVAVNAVKAVAGHAVDLTC